LHPDSYYTSDPDVVVQDAREIARKASDLKLETCLFICGRGIHNPRKLEGRLIGKVEKALRSMKEAHTCIRTSKNGALSVTFDWPIKDEKERRNLDRLGEIPHKRLLKSLPIAKTMIPRVLHDYGVSIPSQSSLADWGFAIQKGGGKLPPRLKEILLSHCGNWAFVELLGNDPVEELIPKSRTLIEFLGGTKEQCEYPSLAKTEKDWSDALSRLTEDFPHLDQE
jgi:hypothetical protein